jgi:hypothetical protein
METLKSCLNSCDSIPVRNGTRPDTIYGPLHIQCGSSAGNKYFRKLVTEVLAPSRVHSTNCKVSRPNIYPFKTS